MIIEIDHEYRIESDEHSWRVTRCRTRKGGTEWEPVTYHASLEQAVRSLYDRRLRLSDAVGVVQVKAEADRILTTLSRALTPRIEVRELVGDA